MPVKTVLFDLDGTLLPMDQDAFVQLYMKNLAAYMAPYGYDPKLLLDALWQGTDAMIKNNGSRTNEDVFWSVFSPVVGRDAQKDEEIFKTFYATAFSNAKAACGFAPMAAEVVRGLKKRGFQVILATNPLFPAVATENRIRWAGLTPEDFDLYTTYENSSSAKPNLTYYEEILKKVGAEGEECLMVGNDVGEDMVAGELGMKTFLLTPCLINRKGLPIDVYAHGDFNDLSAFLDTL